MTFVRLTESDLHNIIRQCITKALDEHELDFTNQGTLYRYTPGIKSR